MANSNPNKISQIQVGDTTYDLVDAEARSFLNYLKSLKILNFEHAESIGFGDSNMQGTYFDINYGSTRDQCIYGQICNLLGCEYYNRGINGAHFESDPTKYHNTWTYIGDQIDNAPASETMSLVVVVGGINDFHYADSNYWHFVDCIKTCVDKIIAKFPNAYILLIWDQGQQEPNQQMLRYAKAMTQVAKDYAVQGVHIIAPFTSDLCFNPGTNGYYYNQNHFNPTGTLEIAKRSIAALFNIPISVEVKRVVVSPESGFSGCTAVVKTEIHPDTFIRTDDIDIFFNTNFSYTGGNTIPQNTTIFKLPFGFDGNTPVSASPNNYKEIYLPMHTMAGTSNGTTPFTSVCLHLFQQTYNYDGYNSSDDTGKIGSPTTELRLQYNTPVSDIADHRSYLHYHNVMIPRSENTVAT